jgi:antitoxin MazE
MRTNIIQIGNSKGIILPSGLLRKLRLSTKSPVNISIEGEKIVIKAEPRQGWAEAAWQMHKANDDKLLIPDVFTDEDLSGLTWEQ